MKKSFAEYAKSSKTHANAVTKLNSKRKSVKRTGIEVVTLPSSGQIDIRISMIKTSQDQIAQLTLIFQLAHFVVSKSKPFKLYADSVKIGSGYLNTSSCIEIILYLSKSKVQTKIVEPINEC